MTAVDLSKFSADKLEQVKEFELVLPDGTTNKDLVVAVKSLASKEGLAKTFEQEDRRRAMMSQMAKEGKIYQDRLQDQVKNALETCVTVTEYIRNGELVIDDKADIQRFFEDYVWARSQVIDHAKDEGFFYGIGQTS